MLITVPADLKQLINVVEYIYMSKNLIIIRIKRSFIIVKFLYGRLKPKILFWVFHYFGTFPKMMFCDQEIEILKKLLKKHLCF